MPRQLWLADKARASGLKVVECSGWKTRGSSTFTPKGLVVHHTAGSSSGDIPTLNILINGHGSLSGPLCQFGLARSGTVYIVAAGRANHAGAGGWRGISGNTNVFGIEAEHTGKSGTPWPKVQMDAYYLLSAMIMEEINEHTDMVCGHKEWAPTRKIDPIDINMKDFRAKVHAIRQHGFSGHTPEEDMPLTSSDYQGIIKAVWVDAKAGRGDNIVSTIQMLAEARRDAAAAKSQAAAANTTARACLTLLQKVSAGDTVTDAEFVALLSKLDDSIDDQIKTSLEDAVIEVNINT